MDDCFIERETLGGLIDTLLAQKYPGTPATELAEVREENIKELDKNSDQEKAMTSGSMS